MKNFFKLIPTIYNFNNIGTTIKNLAKWHCWISIGIIWIASPIALIILLSNIYTVDLWYIPVLIASFTPFLIWLSSLTIYAFGELVEKICDIERNTCSDVRKSDAQSKIANERISKIENLRSQGLITEEEYQQAISKIQ